MNNMFKHIHNNFVLIDKTLLAHVYFLPLLHDLKYQGKYQ